MRRKNSWRSAGFICRAMVLTILLPAFAARPVRARQAIARAAAESSLIVHKKTLLREGITDMSWRIYSNFAYKAVFQMRNKAVAKAQEAEGVEEGAAKEGLAVESSVSKVLGNSYKAMGEVTVPIKNTELLKALNATSKGDWVKVYEAGLQNGVKTETHFFRNNTTNQVFDVKTKYSYWNQKAFKTLGQ